MMDRPLVIYHGNCADGFTAAWLANMAVYQNNTLPHLMPVEWHVDHHPAQYRQSPPDVTDRDVYILDFSYPRDMMLKMGAEANSITLIDHHKTAIENLDGIVREFDSLGLCPLHAVLDDSRSGAYLTARYFWPDNDPADMVKLVDDRDRWVFSDVRTRPFHASLFSRPYAIGEWNRLSVNVPEAVAEGHAINRANLKTINELLDVCASIDVIDCELVPVANMPYSMASDACHIMLERFPDHPFAATWYLDKDGNRVFSLRSRTGTDVDVAEIAARFPQGGGHKHAAGFRVHHTVSVAMV